MTWLATIVNCWVNNYAPANNEKRSWVNRDYALFLSLEDVIIYVHFQDNLSLSISFKFPRSFIYKSIEPVPHCKAGKVNMHH